VKIFKIEISGSVQLSERDIWPDDDGPENPSVTDVIRLLDRHYTLADMIDEWNLSGDIIVDISSGDETVSRRRWVR
jgi:hypothetical protein